METIFTEIELLNLLEKTKKYLKNNNVELDIETNFEDWDSTFHWYNTNANEFDIECFLDVHILAYLKNLKQTITNVDIQRAFDTFVAEEISLEDFVKRDMEDRYVFDEENEWVMNYINWKDLTYAYMYESGRYTVIQDKDTLIYYIFGN